MMTREDAQAIYLEAKASLQQEALDGCWERYDLLPKMVGGAMAIGGALVLSAWLPGVGPWLAWSLAGAIAAGGTYVAGKEGASIERGDNEAISRYIDDERMETLLKPFIEQIQEGMAKKPLGAAAPTNNQSGSGTNPPRSGNESADVAPVLLPIAPCALDDAAPHLLLLGRTREGKSETLKHLVGEAPAVWYVTSKHTDLIPEHWQGYRVGGPTLPDQMRWLLDQWEGMFLKHLEGEAQGTTWFVVDEAVGIMRSLETKGAKATAQRLKGFIVELVTAGAAVGGYIGLLSQTGNSGPLGIDLDLLKNFSVVSCGKRKRTQAIAAFEKLTELRLNPAQVQQVIALPGYVQLWENGGPCLSQISPSALPTKQVIKCPVEDGTSAPQQPQQQPQETTEPKPLEARILDYLKGHGEAKTAREIRGACTRSSDNPRASVDEVRDILALMISDGQIARWEDGSTERYQVTGTA